MTAEQWDDFYIAAATCPSLSSCYNDEYNLDEEKSKERRRQQQLLLKSLDGLIEYECLNEGCDWGDEDGNDSDDDNPAPKKKELQGNQFLHDVPKTDH